jgi:acetylornithine/succinyldiaminopimelate/putrescine aminotransferase
MGEAIHFNTFGGNALGSAVGMAVLDVSKCKLSYSLFINLEIFLQKSCVVQ